MLHAIPVGNDTAEQLKDWANLAGLNFSGSGQKFDGNRLGDIDRLPHIYLEHELLPASDDAGDAPPVLE